MERAGLVQPNDSHSCNDGLDERTTQALSPTAIGARGQDLFCHRRQRGFEISRSRLPNQRVVQSQMSFMSTRYLSTSDLPPTLRRGKPVEQFIGGSPADPACIRHIEICPAGEQVELWVYDVEDVGSEEDSDLYDFPYLEPDGPTAPVATFADTQSAVDFASATLGASPARWVNSGVAESEYLDYIRAGRPPEWPVAS
jgi:hypothetical protein